MNWNNLARLITFLIGITFLNAASLKPYILATESGSGLGETVSAVKENLDREGFTILGDYSPADDPGRRIIIVTHSELITAIQQVGGLTGFAAALRVACTQENGKIFVSYTNPEYIGNAYFQKQFLLVRTNISMVSDKLRSALKETGDPKFLPFGAKNGLSEKKLSTYHYMFGMEYFEDVVELNQFNSFESGKTVIESNLNTPSDEVSPVYSIEIPDRKIKLYGVGLSGESGEEYFLPIIDVGTQKHTAFLPYEILLIDNKAVMLHGRYRIALSFPDLTMMTFSKIMSTPGDIEDLMKNVVRNGD